MKLPENMVDDRAFWPLIMKLQDCVSRELAAANGPALCFEGIVPSQPPFGVADCRDEKSCGIQWIAPMTAYPSTTFPLPQDETSFASCGTSLVMQLEIGVARCHPRPKERMAQADPQHYFEATRLYLSDMQAVRRAILCCLPTELKKMTPERGGTQMSLESWNPIEPGNGFSGGTWTVYLG